MDFSDLFGKKPEAQQRVAATAEDEAGKARDEHARLAEELRPKLQALVQELFAALESAGLEPAEVLGVQGVKAFGLGRVDSRRRRGGPVQADVVIDSVGNIALLHAVQVRDYRPNGPIKVLSCHPLSSDEVLRKACRGDEPTGETRIHLNSRGEIMFTERYIAGDDFHHRRTPLAEYLADLGVRAVTGS